MISKIRKLRPKEIFFFKDFIYSSMIDTEREGEAETQAEGEAGSMHRVPDVGFDPGSPGSRPGPKAGAKPLRHPGTHLTWNLRNNTEDHGKREGKFI